MKFSTDEPLVDGDWVRARLGKLTASRMADAMAFNKNGKESDDRRRYKIELVGERMTDVIVPHFVTPAMEWGLTHEPAAKLAYMKLTGRTIRPATFIDHPSIEFCGCTPDAFVDPDGLLETKCPTTATHMKWIIAGVVPEEHKPQMALQMLCTGKCWVDFCSYDPRLPEKNRAFIRRFEPTQEYLRQIEEAAIQFLKEVDDLFEKVTTAEYVA